MANESQSWVLVAVSGVVALVVPFFGHKFTERRDAAKAVLDAVAARKALLRDKLEQLLTLLDEHQAERLRAGQRVVQFGVCTAHGVPLPDSESSIQMSSLEKADAIVVLYFPSLDAEMKTFAEGNRAHLKFVSDELALVGKDPKAWMTASAEFSTRTSQAIVKMVVARARIAQAARKMIATELSPLTPTDDRHWSVKYFC